MIAGIWRTVTHSKAKVQDKTKQKYNYVRQLMFHKHLLASSIR
jgi:hypothetical protein